MRTIQQFVDGLESPTRVLLEALGSCHLSFRDPEGRPEICRYTHFAQAQVTTDRGSFLLHLPLNDRAEELMRRTTARRATLHTPHLVRASYLVEGIAYCDLRGYCHRADLVVEPLPEGRPLDQLLEEGCNGPALVEALRRMKRSFAQLGIAHNNLKSSNLWFGDEGELVALRGHSLTFEGSTEADQRAFEALERLILQADNSEVNLADEPEHCLRSREELWEVGRMAEGLIRVCHEGFYGFVDCDQQWAIPPRYLWADDFSEGRAEVRCESGFGVIDKAGEYILRPCYERVEWDADSCTIRATLEGREHLYDYDGEPLA